MILDPETYQCPTHGTDLTALVRQQLDQGGVRFAYRGTPRTKPFKVIVSCPGDGTPHPQGCTGTVNR